MRTKRRAHPCKPKLIAASVAACFALPSVIVLANPTGPAVVSGSASFATAGNRLTVVNSANAIIQWQGFSIGVNEITRFLQSSSASAVLNRVVGAGGAIPQSVIDGVLASNGRVFLLNPAGVAIGPTGRIDVAGFYASSLGLSNDDFLHGRMRFTDVPGAGSVVNGGVIQTQSAGRVYLVAPNVENSGVIRSPGGQIVLAAGRSVELASADSPGMTVQVTADAGQALNLGSLIADSGSIGMFGALVRNSGVAEANAAVAGPGGQIRFVASQDVTLDAGSRTSANGTSGGEVVLQAQGGTNLVGGTVEATGSTGAGGTVQALGVRVGVIGNGVIDASGASGGGTVLVGGDAHGANPTVQNAQSTYIGPDGVIRADAGASGNGGRVIVWADGDTGFYGSVSARGGSQSGNGGFVEASGKRSLGFAGSTVDTRAPSGSAGLWQIDPSNIAIDANEASTLATSMQCGNVEVTATGDGTGSYGNINFQSDLNLTKGSGNTFTALAGENINLATHTITTSGHNVVLTANASGYCGSGNGSITSTMAGSSTQIATDGGNVTLTGTAVTVAGIDTRSSSTGTAGGNVDVSASSGNIVTGAINTSGSDGSDETVQKGGDAGSISLSASGAVTSDPIRANGGAGASNEEGTSGDGGAGGSISFAGTAITVGKVLSATGGAGGNVGAGGGGGAGGNGGSIQFGTLGIPVGSIFTGGIDVSGGAGGAGYSSYDGGRGGNGGSIQAYSNSTITISSITGLGGAGGAAAGGKAGDGGEGAYVVLGDYSRPAGAVLTGPIYLDGGAGGSSSGGDGGEGAFGGILLVYANSISTGSITARGGAGGSGLIGGDGGEGGYVSLDTTSGTPGPVQTGAVDISGGDGGTGSGIRGGMGGGGGELYAYGTSVSVASISGRGGVGGTDSTGGDGGEGGYGSYVQLDATSPGGTGALSVGAVDLSGGAGANSSAAQGGDGGEGGQAYFDALTSIATGSVTTSGGRAGASGPGYAGAIGGSGGPQYYYGGSINIAAAIAALGGAGGAGGSDQSGGAGGAGGAVSMNDNDGAPSFYGAPAPVTTAGIDTSGGAGGAGGPAASPAGSGGIGGTGGNVTVYGGAVTINGLVTTLGGPGGAGGAGDGTNASGAGGTGGTGGNIWLDASSGTGIVTFMNGGYDAGGGVLGLAGADGGAGAGSAGIEGIPGVVTILNQLVFAFTPPPTTPTAPEVSVPLESVPLDLLSAIINGSDRSIGLGGMLGGEQEQEEDNKKKGVGICKP